MDVIDGSDGAESIRQCPLLALADVDAAEANLLAFPAANHSLLQRIQGRCPGVSTSQSEASSGPNLMEERMGVIRTAKVFSGEKRRRL